MKNTRILNDDEGAQKVLLSFEILIGNVEPISVIHTRARANEKKTPENLTTALIFNSQVRTTYPRLSSIRRERVRCYVLFIS